MKNCEYLGKGISSPLMLCGRYTPRQWSCLFLECFGIEHFRILLNVFQIIILSKSLILKLLIIILNNVEQLVLDIFLLLRYNSLLCGT